MRRRACECLEDLPGYANTVIGDLLSEVTRLDERVAQYDAHIQTMAKDDERARAKARSLNMQRRAARQRAHGRSKGRDPW